MNALQIFKLRLTGKIHWVAYEALEKRLYSFMAIRPRPFPKGAEPETVIKYFASWLGEQSNTHIISHGVEGFTIVAEDVDLVRFKLTWL